MSFLSFTFAVFVGVALLVFYLAPARWRPGLLLAFSYAFYLSWGVAPTILLLAVTTGVYFTARWIESRRTEGGKRAWMALGVMSLLVLLFAYKAGAWLLKEFSSSSPGTEWSALLVPLGLSYYVFKMIGYLLDVYWETIPAQRNFVMLALYGSFFPQIISGPIQRAETFFGQLECIKNPDSAEFLIGLRRILFGLVKKVIIADRLGVLVANIHGHPADFSSLELLAGAYGYAIQLYLDFSGITDIALGIGLLFGVRGPENFDLPFFAPNLQIYWRRWHMSLTTWLTDYLFTPLRMSLRNLGQAGLILAIFLNMGAIGLWHGLAWTFLIFGLIHGCFMTVSVLTLKRRNLFFQHRPALDRVRKFVGPLATFHLVAFALIFFRAQSFASALRYLSGLVPGCCDAAAPVLRFNPALVGLSPSILMLCIVAFLASDAVTWAAQQPSWRERFFGTPVLLRRAIYCALIAAVLLLFQGTVTFIYAGF